MPRQLMAAAAVLLACASMAGGYWLRGLRADREVAAVELQLRTARAEAAAAAFEASERFRRIEQARAFELEKVTRDAQRNIDQARRDAAAADVAADRLRQRAAALAAACRPAVDPTPADAGAPAAGPGLVLSDLLGRSDETSGELAAAFDQSRAAGLACERSYDALRDNPR